MAEAIFDQILAERRAQDERWGEQNHQSTNGEVTGELNCWAAGLPNEMFAKNTTELMASVGELSWSHIAVEELVEAVSAENDKDRRVELIQLAAVVVAWIECIDRNNRGHNE